MTSHSISGSPGRLRGRAERCDVLVKTTPDLLVARREYSARAVKAATLEIPVVFVEVGDPLAADLVASVRAPAETSPGSPAWPQS